MLCRIAGLVGHIGLEGVVAIGQAAVAGQEIGRQRYRKGAAADGALDAGHFGRTAEKSKRDFLTVFHARQGAVDPNAQQRLLRIDGVICCHIGQGQGGHRPIDRDSKNLAALVTRRILGLDTDHHIPHLAKLNQTTEVASDLTVDIVECGLQRLTQCKIAVCKNLYRGQSGPGNRETLLKVGDLVIGHQHIGTGGQGHGRGRLVNRHVDAALRVVSSQILSRDFERVLTFFENGKITTDGSGLDSQIHLSFNLSAHAQQVEGGCVGDITDRQRALEIRSVVLGCRVHVEYHIFGTEQKIRRSRVVLNLERAFCRNESNTIGLRDIHPVNTVDRCLPKQGVERCGETAGSGQKSRWRGHNLLRVTVHLHHAQRHCGTRF